MRMMVIVWVWIAAICLAAVGGWLLYRIGAPAPIVCCGIFGIVLGVPALCDILSGVMTE